MANPGLALLSGFGGGYISGQQQKIENERLAARDQREQETHDAQMADTRRSQELQASLAAAAQPAQVDIGAGGMTKPPTADNSDVGQPGEPGADNGGLIPGALVNGQPAGSPADAAAAAASYNDPSAVGLRQVQAYNAAGKPLDALNLQKGQAAFTQQQVETARKLKEEGIIDAAKAARTGNAQDLFDAFNKSGTSKFVSVPTVTTEEKDLPGFGKVKTYTYTGTIQNPDGTTREGSMNSHDLSMLTMPYEKLLDLQRKGQQTEELGEYRSGLLDVKGKVADAQASAAQAKAEATAARNAQGPTREERLRWTSLFQDAGRQMIETQKTINQLQRDPVFMSRARKDPNSAEAQQLSDLQGTLKDHQKSRDTFRGLLAGSAGGPSLAAASGTGDAGAPAAAGSAPSGPKRIGSQAERDALPKGTPYIAPDGNTYIKQ